LPNDETRRPSSASTPQVFFRPDESALQRASLPGAVSSGQNMMNQYLVFTYYVGRSWGGMKDFLDSFDTVEEALENLLPEPTRYFQIVDRDTLKIVKEGLTIFKDCDPEAFRKG
jgi:hypothetical protein